MAGENWEDGEEPNGGLFGEDMLTGSDAQGGLVLEEMLSDGEYDGCYQRTIGSYVQISQRPKKRDKFYILANFVGPIPTCVIIASGRSRRWLALSESPDGAFSISTTEMR